MKIAIYEVDHFFGNTLCQIFANHEITIITNKEFGDSMKAYTPDIQMHHFLYIDNLKNDKRKVIDYIKESRIDIFIVCPIFAFYYDMLCVFKNINCKKILTIHNLNTWFYHRFWSPLSLWNKICMKLLIENSTYIAVEDFIFNHLKSTKDVLFEKYNFIYIPYSLYSSDLIDRKPKVIDKVRVVLVGSIDCERRDYGDVMCLIDHFYRTNETEHVQFHFAGMPKGKAGETVKNKLLEYSITDSDYVKVFDSSSTVQNYLDEMRDANLLIASSKTTFEGNGTLEYIGKTKPTGALNAAVTFQLPSLMPSHLSIPEEMKESIFSYASAEELINIFRKIIDNKKILGDWNLYAIENSKKYTPEFVLNSIANCLK